MDWEELEEEEKEQEHRKSNQDADIEGARDQDHRVRVPIRRPRQLPKALIFHTRRPPVGWLSGVRSAVPPKPNPVPILENNNNPKPEVQMPVLEEEDKNREKSMEEVE